MFSNDFRNVLFTFFVLIFLPLEAWSEGFHSKFQSLEIQMRGEVRVSNNRILLGDTATIYAKNRSDFNRLSEIEIVRLSENRKSITIPFDYLASRIREVLGAEKEFHLTAPKEVKFLREQFGLSPAEVANEIWRMGKMNGTIPGNVEIEVVPVAGFEELSKIPFGNFKISSIEEKSEWRGVVDLQVSTADLPNPISRKIKVNVKWFANALVAKRKIKFLDDLRVEDFTWIKKEITDLPRDLVLADTEDAARAALRGTRARKVIVEESPLQFSQLDKKADLASGQALKVVFISESGLKVSADGALIAPGILGETAKARLKTSRKVVSGRLVSEGVMEVSL